MSVTEFCQTVKEWQTFAAAKIHFFTQPSASCTNIQREPSQTQNAHLSPLPATKIHAHIYYIYTRCVNINSNKLQRKLSNTAVSWKSTLKLLRTRKNGCRMFAKNTQYKNGIQRRETILAGLQYSVQSVVTDDCSRLDVCYSKECKD